MCGRHRPPLQHVEPAKLNEGHIECTATAAHVVVVGLVVVVRPLVVVVAGTAHVVVGPVVEEVFLEVFL